MNVQLFVLPLASVATEVTSVPPTGKAEPLGGVLVTLITPPQLSEAVTLKVTLLEHRPAAALTVMFAGHMITGAWVSRTVTVNVQVLVLPAASIAVLVTTVVPTRNDEPLGGTLTITGVPGQLSVPVTVKVTLLEHWPGAVLTVMLAGQLMLGGCVSRTMTRCWQKLVLPLVSVTIQVTTFVPTGSCAGALLDTLKMAQLSLTDGLPSATPVA
jgi:hypothetical protein